MNINNKITQIKKTIILIANIKSCYDNISIEWLDYFIDANKDSFSLDGLKQWKILKKMALDNHLSIGKDKFLRGIPQGGFLSPFLCNFIISKIMNICIKSANINKDDIFIYADNILLKNQDNYSQSTILSKFKIIQDTFGSFGLTFHEPKMYTINGLLELNFSSFAEDFKKIEPNSVFIEEIKFLGIKFIVIKNKCENFEVNVDKNNNINVNKIEHKPDVIDIKLMSKGDSYTNDVQLNKSNLFFSSYFSNLSIKRYFSMRIDELDAKVLYRKFDLIFKKVCCYDTTMVMIIDDIFHWDKPPPNKCN